MLSSSLCFWSEGIFCLQRVVCLPLSIPLKPLLLPLRRKLLFKTSMSLLLYFIFKLSCIRVWKQDLSEHRREQLVSNCSDSTTVCPMLFERGDGKLTDAGSQHQTQNRLIRWGHKINIVWGCQPVTILGNVYKIILNAYPSLPQSWYWTITAWFGALLKGCKMIFFFLSSVRVRAL